MIHFKNEIESHEHSLSVLKLLYEYDSFMDSISVVADMGCGSGLDANWWATLMNREDPPKPHDYIVYAVDKNISRLDPNTQSLANVVPIQGDFNERIIPRAVDLVWSHDSFQYSIDPLRTLHNWNNMMNVNGMLVLMVPQHQSYEYDRIKTCSYSGSYYHYNVCNLMYMLAVNGFDCRDCYVWTDTNNNWLYFAVYKSFAPLDPAATSWHDLADLKLINDSAMESLNKYGYIRQEELLFSWLDKDLRFAKN
jgi:hypothetical protein